MYYALVGLPRTSGQVRFLHQAGFDLDALVLLDCPSPPLPPSSFPPHVDSSSLSYSLPPSLPPSVVPVGSVGSVGSGVIVPSVTVGKEESDSHDATNNINNNSNNGNSDKCCSRSFAAHGSAYLDYKDAAFQHILFVTIEKVIVLIYSSIV